MAWTTALNHHDGRPTVARLRVVPPPVVLRPIRARRRMLAARRPMDLHLHLRILLHRIRASERDAFVSSSLWYENRMYTVYIISQSYSIRDSVFLPCNDRPGKCSTMSANVSLVARQTRQPVFDPSDEYTIALELVTPKTQAAPNEGEDNGTIALLGWFPNCNCCY